MVHSAPANRRQATQLRQRREELTELLTATPTGSSDKQLAALTTAITDAIDEADPNGEPIPAPTVIADALA